MRERRLSVVAFGFAVATCATVGAGAAQDTGASVSMGTSYSSLRGGLAFVTFDAPDLLGSDTDVRFRYEEGEDGNAVLLRIGKAFELGDTRLGRNSYVLGTIEGATSDWTSQDYALGEMNVDLRFGADLTEMLDYEVRMFWSSDDLKRFGSGVSPLVTSEAGYSTAAGFGLNLSRSTYDRPVLPTTGSRLSLDLAVATPLGDREWAAYAITGGIARPLGDRAVFTLGGEAGHIEGLGGQSVQLVDRAFLGNPMPRGFAFGGLGPRDLVAGPGGVDSPLGGNSYATATAELRFATPNPAVQIGAFVDAASLWNLDVTTGGASGTIDDDFHLRASAGLSVYWDSPLGLLQANFAAPFEKRDYDEEEYFSVGLSVRF